jgi:sulfur carrier protein ThiS
MAIELKLVGFGDHRPPRFDAGNRLRLEVGTPATVRQLLNAAGIDEAPDLIVMDTLTVIPSGAWDQSNIADGTRLTILCAIEGG